MPNIRLSFINPDHNIVLELGKKLLPTLSSGRLVVVVYKNASTEQNSSGIVYMQK